MAGQSVPNYSLTTVNNVRRIGLAGLWQITIAEGKISLIQPQPEQSLTGQGVLDAQGGLALPPFIEPHIHLDTTQTAGQPSWNQSGTLFEGIERWAERKARLTREDVKQRAWQTLKWQIANGIQHVRTHVDVSDPHLTALSAMLEVKEEVSPWVDMQIVAFPQEGILSYPDGAALLEEALRLGADAVGAIPILNLPANMAWNLCISRLHWRKNISGWWMFIAMKRMMSNRALSKPWRRWPFAKIWAHG